MDGTAHRGRPLQSVFAGNNGWAETFNQHGRKERNSFVDIVQSGPHRAWVRWNYLYVNKDDYSHPALRGTETILIVEDEKEVGFFLETILGHHGYHVLSARDPGEALKIFEENQDQVSLVFSDVGLPGLDGISLCMKESN